MTVHLCLDVHIGALQCLAIRRIRKCLSPVVFFGYSLTRNFYARKQLLLSSRLSHRNSVCLSVRHTGRSVKNDTG